MHANHFKRFTNSVDQNELSQSGISLLHSIIHFSNISFIVIVSSNQERMPSVSYPMGLSESLNKTSVSQLFVALHYNYLSPDMSLPIVLF